MGIRATSRQAQRAAQLLRASKHAVALTGAGFSTPSGIPDFRSAVSGIWQHVDPMEVASLTSFRHDPEKFYGWFHSLALTISAATPNAAHDALAHLEQAGLLDGIVTQNVDGLHQQAGSSNVCEIHGHLRSAVCVQCFTRHSGVGIFASYVETGEAPTCAECAGYLKPEVVLFGEQLPREPLALAERMIDQADMVLVCGSSLEVTPAADLPYRALQNGAKLIIVNQEPTYLDARADVVFAGDVSEFLPMVTEEVLIEH